MNVQAIYKKLNDQTRRDYLQLTLHALIRQQCLKTPDAIAVLDREATQTYSQLDQRSDILAAHLIAHGIGPGDLVGLCCNRDVDTPALLVGILKSGAGYVPLDPDYPVDRLNYMAQNADLKHIIAHSQKLPITNQFNLPTTVVDRDWNIVKTETFEASLPQTSIRDVAYMIYTSGSTGLPKGVLVPHQSVVNMLCSMLEWPGFTAKDRILATTTLSFDISVAEMFMPLLVGGSVAVIDRQTAKDTQALVAAIEKFKVTFMQATPAMWRMILETDFPGQSDMKFITAGEPLPRDLIRPMLNRCSEVWNLYGPTETTVYSTGTQITTDEGPISIGVPVANTQIYIVDDHDRLCPPGTPGELLIAGDGMTLGYHKRPELNAEKFANWHGTPVYRTGDLARLTDNGQIDHLGRIDDQIKFNGHRIELGEIDAALAMQPGVRQAATVLREDRPGDKRLVGYLLPNVGVDLDVSKIRESFSRSLPDYMVPNIIEVVDQFHYTPSGKLDRKSFPAPSTTRPDLGNEYIAPQTDAESQLASIWSDVLQLENPGVRDNFFELGGNSIRAVKVVARVKQEMGIALTGAEFFDNPTIESLLNLANRKRNLVEKLQSKTTQPRRQNEAGRREYAIVGMAARMPGAADLDQFWNNLVNGIESIKFFTPDELDVTLDPRDTMDANYVAARGIIDEADHFDANFFRMPPRNAELTCPQQRIMLELAWTALEDAGVIPNRSTSTIGIWAGTYSTSYFIKNILTNPDLMRQTDEFQMGTYHEKDYIATRVAHALNLTGPAINVNTACSTSLVALIEACNSLDAGHCDVALAGAASVTFPQNSGHLHQSGSIFTPDGHCRPFDADAGGTLFSDGAGVVAVKRLTDAMASGDRIYAVVKGFGINNDGGEKASFSAPNIHGQANAIAMAHAMGNVSPDTIGYIEAHGTATPIGDPIEISALQTVFEAKTQRKQFCALGSVKSNIGHTVAAAGVAGLIKVAMSLHQQQIPATLHYQKSNPEIDFENSPFYVCDHLTQWRRGSQPRRAGVSSFGVGGTNAHILLEEAPLPPTPSELDQPVATNDLPVCILPISGKTEAAMAANLSRMADHFDTITCNDENNSPVIDDLRAIEQTLQFRRDAFAYRSAIVTDNLVDAVEAIRSKKTPRFINRKASATNRDVVFMFPGQGSQYVRMGQNLYQHSHVFRKNLDRCADNLLPLLKRDLRDVLFPSTDSEAAAQEILKNTQYTQPALFALGYSLTQMWLEWGIAPTAMMGHSIGEFAAACVAGVFSLEDGLRIIAHRGASMQCLPGGSMMSVRLPGAEVEPKLWGEMAIGSYNGPSLCVVSGPTDQVEQLRLQFESQDVPCRYLHTSHAFHSPMMNEIVAPFAKFVSQFQLSPPQIPILSTVTGQWMTDQQATDPQYWAEHLRQPVRFYDAVAKMWNDEDGDPNRILIELGPRRVLATLAKQHANDPKHQLAIATLSDTADDNAEWYAMLTAVAQLWSAGGSVDWSRLSSDGQQRTSRPHVSLPTYQFQRKRYFIQPGIPISSPPATPPNTSNQHCVTDCETVASHNELTTHPIKRNTTSTTQESVAVSRIANLVEAINNVFENTSGFDLGEFDSDTTFFEMGLDSLVLTQVATALKKEMGYEITFRQLLEVTSTVDSLAAWLDAKLPPNKYASDVVTEYIPSTPTAQAVEPNPALSASTQMPRPTSAAAPMSSTPIPAHGVTAKTKPVQVAVGSAVGSAVEAIVQDQLKLMAAQLQLLGASVAPNEMHQNQTAQIAPSTAQPIADQSHVAETNNVAPLPARESAPLTSTTECSESNEMPETEAPKSKRFATIKLNDGQLDKQQQEALDHFIRINNVMLPNSKSYTQTHRRYLADPRTVSGFRPNMKEMTHPIVVEKSKGVHLWDIDGNQYIDFTCGFGSNLLGHTHEITVAAITEQIQKDYAIGPQSPLAGEVAKLFCELTGNERMAFSNTGSEAVLGCTRLARNATGRDLIVMFNGDYHGILDEVIARGSKKLKSFPAATGIPKDHVQNTLILDYGAPESLDIIRQRIDEIAAVLVEPVQSRTPELQPKSFLQELRKITENEPTCLIFDEVISGLRIGLGGAQEYFGFQADLAAYGKIVGGGMPIGVVAGKAKYMDGLDGGFWQYGDDSGPETGMTYFAGTFVRHPLTLAASRAILEHLKAGGQPMYDRLNALSDYLATELNLVFKELDAPLFLANFGSLFKIQFLQELPYSEIFFAGLRRRGMHIWDHRPCLLTLAHEQPHVDSLVAAVRDTIIECQRFGFMPGDGHRRVETRFDANQPPQLGARVGRDETGNPGWFIADVNNPGQYIQTF